MCFVPSPLFLFMSKFISSSPVCISSPASSYNTIYLYCPTVFDDHYSFAQKCSKTDYCFWWCCNLEADSVDYEYVLLFCVIICRYLSFFFFFFFNDTATTEIYTLSLHDALPIFETTQSSVNRSIII